VADVGAEQRQEYLRRDPANRPPADHDVFQSELVDQVFGVFRQGRRIVGPLASRLAEARVVERHDREASCGQTVEERRIPEIEHTSESIAQDDRWASAYHPVRQRSPANVGEPCRRRQRVVMHSIFLHWLPW
jgi:hypothetical protein